MLVAQRRLRAIPFHCRPEGTASPALALTSTLASASDGYPRAPTLLQELRFRFRAGKQDRSSPGREHAQGPIGPAKLRMEVCVPRRYVVETGTKSHRRTKWTSGASTREPPPIVLHSDDAYITYRSFRGFDAFSPRLTSSSFAGQMNLTVDRSGESAGRDRGSYTQAKQSPGDGRNDRSLVNVQRLRAPASVLSSPPVPAHTTAYSSLFQRFRTRLPSAWHRCKAPIVALSSVFGCGEESDVVLERPVLSRSALARIPINTSSAASSLSLIGGLRRLQPFLVGQCSPYTLVLTSGPLLRRPLRTIRLGASYQVVPSRGDRAYMQDRADWRRTLSEPTLATSSRAVPMSSPPNNASNTVSANALANAPVMAGFVCAITTEALSSRNTRTSPLEIEGARSATDTYSGIRSAAFSQKTRLFDVELTFLVALLRRQCKSTTRRPSSQ